MLSSMSDESDASECLPPVEPPKYLYVVLGKILNLNNASTQCKTNFLSVAIFSLTQITNVLRIHNDSMLHAVIKLL